MSRIPGPPNPEPVQAQPALSEAIASVLTTNGFDASQFASDSEAIAALAAAAKYAQSLEGQMGQFKQELNYYRQQQAAQPQQPQAPPQQPQQANPEEWDEDGYWGKQWGAPKYDKQWESYIQRGLVVRDPQKGYVPAPGSENVVPWHVITGLNESASFMRTGLEDLLTGNPYKKTWSAIQEPLKRTVDKLVQERLQEAQQRQEADQWEASNAHWLYQKQGEEFIIDPATGGPKLSPAGERFYSHLQAVRNEGVKGYKESIQRAFSLTKADVTEAAYAQQQAAAQQQQQQAQPAAPPSQGQPQAQPNTAAQAAPATNGAASQQPAKPQRSFMESAAMHNTATNGSAASASPATVEEPIQTSGQLNGIIERTARSM